MDPAVPSKESSLGKLSIGLVCPFLDRVQVTDKNGNYRVGELEKEKHYVENLIWSLKK